MARIGISLCVDAAGRWRAGRTYHYLDSAYAAAVRDAGGHAVYLPPAGDPDALLQGIDGLLLPGGDDLPPPAPYPPDVRFDLVDPAQRAFDGALLAAARARGLPVLGICYGAQLLAAELGGGLHYHLPHDLPGAGPHQLDAEGGRHPLVLEPSTRLAALLGPAPPPVNSLHHQAIADPGPALRVAACAGDGVIEAVEAVDGPFCVGVQWHPEKLRGPHRNALFAGFVAAARGG